MIEIRAYSKEWEERHTQFASRFWKKRGRITPEYIYWKFRGSENEELTSFLLAVENNVIVGQFGVIPCKIEVEGIEYEAQWACDLMVDPNYRGKGIAEKLYEHAHQLRPITLGSDPSPAAQKSMTKKGYVAMDGSWKFIFPVNLNELLKVVNKGNRFFNAFYNPFFLIFKGIGAFTPHRYTQQPLEFNVGKKLQSAMVQVVRDESFVQWRFQKFKDYYKEVSTFSKKDGSFFSGFYHNKIYYITDFQVNGVMNFIEIVLSLVKNYRDMVRIKVFCNSESIASWLPWVGFVKFRTKTKVIFYTEDFDLKYKLKNKKFYYSLLDSDENI